MRKRFTIMALLIGATALSGCATVDETEHCIRTRYGDVKNQHMDQGLQFTGLVDDVTCFKLTEQDYPEDGGVEQMRATTADKLDVTGDLSVLWAFDPETVFQVFLDKRSQEAAEIEIRNAIREGYRNAIASWNVDDIFSSRRAEMSDSVRAHIQRKVGSRATIIQAYVRDIAVPKTIQEARTRAAAQQQELDRMIQQARIDSINAAIVVMQAEASSRAKELEAEAYAEHPQLLQLRIAEQLKSLCANAQTCILGGSVMDSWFNAGGR